MNSLEYQLHHFARAFGKWPWEIPDDAALVMPHLQIMAADGRGQAKLRKRMEQQARRQAGR